MDQWRPTFCFKVQSLKFAGIGQIEALSVGINGAVPAHGVPW